ncbi:hypothetical protein AOLI_G00119170 [Acnodon oligacanthus]
MFQRVLGETKPREPEDNVRSTCLRTNDVSVPDSRPMSGVRVCSRRAEVSRGHRRTAQTASLQINPQ